MVSVLIPAYNAEKTIHRSLDSILAQTYCDIEVIVVNDGSTDSTLAELQAYAKKDERVKVIDQLNSGVAAARNTALDNASGEYILYVDADDWIEPDTVERLLNRMSEDTDIVFCSSDHAETPEHVQCELQAECEIWDRDRQILEFLRHKRMTGMLWNKLIRRSLTDGISFNEKTGYGEDAEFLWQILKKSRKMVVTNEVLYHHVLEDTSISHLSFSEKKYSAIPMWESITEEVERDYPELLSLAKERLMCAAVYSGYEMKKAEYKNEIQKRHIQEIVKKNWKEFIKSDTVSSKMKIYATVIRGGGKVSVIVPIYNTEKYLEKCLDSIRTQTYSDIEVIMVDDGSTDGSKNVANGYAERDNRFRLFSQENAGVSAARNHGLDVAEGEYILFVDSDDWLEPQMIEKLVYNMIAYSTDISACQYDRSACFTGETTEVWNRNIALQYFLVHKQINGSLVNKLFKKEIVECKRLDESIKYGEDAWFFWKNLLDIRSIAVSPDVLYHVTLHDDSASGGGSYKPIRRDCIRVWKLISQDAVQVSVELGCMARAQLGNMAFFSLYEMGYYGCKNEEHQKEYLNTLRNTIMDLYNASFIPYSEKCLAWVFLLNIYLGKAIVRLKKKFRLFQDRIR